MCGVGMIKKCGPPAGDVMQVIFWRSEGNAVTKEPLPEALYWMRMVVNDGGPDAGFEGAVYKARPASNAVLNQHRRRGPNRA